MKENQRQEGGLQFGGEIDLRQLLKALLNGRYIIALFGTVFAAAAVVYVLLLPPIYRANSFILIENNALGSPGLEGTGEIITSQTSVIQELEVIKIGMVMGKVVDELDLTTHTSPIYLPLIGAALARRHADVSLANAVFGLESYAWGGERLRVSYLQVPRRYLGQSLELIALDGQRFSLYHNGEKLLTGSFGEKAFGLDGGIQILVDSLTGRPGTRFDVKKSGRFDAMLNLQSTLSVSEKGKGMGILEIALEGADKDHILEVIDSVTNHYYLQKMRRLSLRAESTLDFLEQQILGLKADLAYSEEALNDFRREHVSLNLSLEAGATLDSLVQIETKISVMSIDEIEISRRYTPEHPSYISFKLRQEKLQEKRFKLIAKLARLPYLQREMLDLTRDFEVHQAILTSLDSRRLELSMLQANRMANVRLMQETGATLNIVAPNHSLVAILGTLLGGVLGVMLVLLRFGIRIDAEVAGANNRDYQKLPTKIPANMADRNNLLTPEELDALMEIGSGSYQ